MHNMRNNIVLSGSPSTRGLYSGSPAKKLDGVLFASCRGSEDLSSCPLGTPGPLRPRDPARPSQRL